ncbi:MAG TPA: regulatory protein GemA [bacterium]|nr:regulatory protein GemA [bacterium]
MRNGNISNKQIRVIHVAKRELGLDDDQYRDLLYAVTGKRSSKDLTAAETKEVVATLERLGFKPQGPRPAGKATAAQVALVKALWREAARMPSENYLSVWLLNAYRVDRPEDLTFDDASRAIEALKAMKRRALATAGGGIGNAA